MSEAHDQPRKGAGSRGSRGRAFPRHDWARLTVQFTWRVCGEAGPDTSEGHVRTVHVRKGPGSVHSGPWPHRSGSDPGAPGPGTSPDSAPPQSPLRGGRERRHVPGVDRLTLSPPLTQGRGRGGERGPGRTAARGPCLGLPEAPGGLDTCRGRLTGGGPVRRDRGGLYPLRERPLLRAHGDTAPQSYSRKELGARRQQAQARAWVLPQGVQMRTQPC